MTQIPDINSFIGEELPAGEGGFEWVRPQDGKTVGRIVEAGAAGVDAAVTAAKAAFQAHRLSPTHKRIALLKTGAAVLIKHAEELALLISEDVGKPIKAARFEARRGAEFLEATASALSQLASEVLPVDITQAGEGHFGFTRRHPYGVVAGVTPFNAPINLLIQKVAPAIAAGNAIITKPAPAAMRTSLRVVKLFQEEGWPKGLFTVLTGDKPTATALVKHPDVRMISFTGGTAGGDALARAAGAKKFVAELGSNAANIVLADADIADAAKRIASAAFEASGQQCISAQRVLVDSKVLSAFVEKFVEAAKGLKVGRADDPSTDVGPMVSSASADRVVGMCEDAIKRGARYVLEPKRDGAILSPGILVEVPQPARLWQEEVFGPIAIVMPFDDLDHALRLANDSPFGLQGAVFTRDLRSAFRFSNEFDVGSLWVNEASRFRLDLYPFGGMKTSGVGREGVRYAIEEFSQIKFTGIRY
jgi:acyl-CoA reductase-like NAD-dependent aldehyde dehydrogenase